VDTAQLNVSIDELLGPRLARLQSGALVAALVGLVLTGLGFVVDKPDTIHGVVQPNPVYHSYLYAYVFWFGVTAGSLGLLMLHHVVGGGWGFVLRRFLEAATRLFPLVTLLFIPVAIGMWSGGLYAWNAPGMSAHLAELVHKRGFFMTPVGFLVFSAIYFLIYGFFAWQMNRFGRLAEMTDDPAVFERANKTAAFGILIYCLTTTFVAVHWVMSLTPHWLSSIFGMLTIVSQGLSTMALMLALLGIVGGDAPLLRAAPSGLFRDLGNLTLAFVMLWAYMSFSQYLITYSGNTAEEITWYVARRQGGWQWISLSLIPLHFFAPFFILLTWSELKKHPERLAKLAIFIILMRLLDLYWWITPTFRPTFHFGIADFGTPLLIGGIWLWAWAAQLKGKPVVPIHDLRLTEYLQEAAHHA
jgi:hypothetical protein